MFPPHASATPGAPPGVGAHPPLSAMFHALAARGLQGKPGQGISPGPPVQAGAPMPLGATGQPARPFGHAPAMGR